MPAVDVDPSALTEAGTGSAATSSSDLAPGGTVGKYRLDRVLGAGGMGVVWAAFDPDLERPLAIKVLRAVDSVATLRTRLLREARAMARLKHPNVLTVYDVGTDRGRDYIAMELIAGADLDAWLATRPPRPDVVAALLDAGRGLAAAHEAGLIHRDLKPHNILRSTGGEVYVTDFGLARGQLDDSVDVAHGSAPARAPDSVLDAPLTQTGVMIGTPAYMAPEQFTGHAPDPRSDQFAFCVTAWEALTGARPFTGKTPGELLASITRGLEGEGGADGRADLPPRVRAVLTRGLAADPAARWPDLRVLLRELEAAFAPPPRSRRWMWGAGAVALIALGTVFGEDDPTPTPPRPPAPPSRRGTVARAPGCQPPAAALGAAWSTERKRAVQQRHAADGELVGVIALFDETRRLWLGTYEAACAQPESAARHQALACLYTARDELDEASRELATDPEEVSVARFAHVPAIVAGCLTDPS